MKRFIPIFVGLLGACVSDCSAQGTRPNSPPDLAGDLSVYSQRDDSLQGGLKKFRSSPTEFLYCRKPPNRPRRSTSKTIRCERASRSGPFRMMARDGITIELAPATGLIAMLFEDYLHGVMRIVYMNRGHVEHVVDGPEPGMEPGPTWLGDSIGRWEGDTLLIDTVGFNTRTWLNDAGAQHSEALHLIERIRPVLGGQYLEYKMTAEDPNTLAKPYTYTRYFKKIDQEIEDDVCTDEP